MYRPYPPEKELRDMISGCVHNHGNESETLVRLYTSHPNSRDSLPVGLLRQNTF